MPLSTVLVQALTGNKILRACFVASGTLFPWLMGMLTGYLEAGIIMSFGCYLVVASFTFLPEQHRFKLLLQSAILLSAYAAIGIYTTMGSFLFFLFAVLFALSQCIAELRNNYLRVPVALATLGFFLSVNQVPQQGASFYAVFFMLGCFWGIVIAYIGISTTTKTLPTCAIHVRDQKQQRFGIAMIIASLLGSSLACFTPGSHPCWLPAATLRVMKPTKEQTRYRIKARIIGSVLGAAVGGVLLGISTLPYLRLLLVYLIIVAMLLITAKRYAGWTFCLTAVALAFNLGLHGDIVTMAFNRAFLTAGGICVALLMLFIIPHEQSQQ